MALPSYYFPSSYKEGRVEERRIPRAGGVEKMRRSLGATVTGHTFGRRAGGRLCNATPATMADFAGQEGGKKVRVAINGFGRVGRM